MNFKLNRDKSSFLMIGKTLFTYDDPDHSITDLSDPLIVRQLVYNCQVGILDCDKKSELFALVVPEPPKTPAPARAPVAPTPPPKIDPMKPIATQATVEAFMKDELQELRSLLKQRVPSIKKALPDLSIRKLRKLKELEEGWKNRKALLSDIDALLLKHSSAVGSSIEATIADETKITFPGQINISGVTDVVESEIETITINLED